MEIGDFVKYNNSFYHIKEINSSGIDLSDYQNGGNGVWLSLNSKTEIKIITPFKSKTLKNFSTLKDGDIFLNKKGDYIRITNKGQFQWIINNYIWRGTVRDLRSCLDTNHYVLNGNEERSPSFGDVIKNNKGEKIGEVIGLVIQIGENFYTEEAIKQFPELDSWFPIKQPLYVKVGDKFFPKKVLNNLMENYSYSIEDNNEENQNNKELKIIYI